MRAKPSLVSSVDELRDAQGSFYCPAALNSTLCRSGLQDKVGVVALPCQAQGLSNLCKLIPAWEENISIVIGLICERVLYFSSIDHLIKTSNLNSCDVKHIRFKDSTSVYYNYYYIGIEPFKGDVYTSWKIERLTIEEMWLSCTYNNSDYYIKFEEDEKQD